MLIECTNINRILIVKINGDIDHCSSEEIRLKIDKDFERINGKDILFDFSNVDFMDSSGIGMIIGRYKNVELKGGQIAFFNISENLKRIFEISGLLKIIYCFDSKEEAIKALTLGGVNYGIW